MVAICEQHSGLKTVCVYAPTVLGVGTLDPEAGCSAGVTCTADK